MKGGTPTLVGACHDKVILLYETSLALKSIGGEGLSIVVSIK